MDKCNHKWVDVGGISNDKFCVKCENFAKQMYAKAPENFPVVMMKMDDLLAEVEESVSEAIQSLRG